MNDDKKENGSLFPQLQRNISDFLFDQEGNIPRSKILTVGSMMILLSVLLMQDAFAKHRSHSSHKSHSSHSSHSSGSGGHSSHASHSSHSSHSSSASSHSSHSSHSSTHVSGTASQSSTPSSSGTSAVPGAEQLPSVSEILPPQVPQTNNIPADLSNITAAVPAISDAGAAPDFSD